MAGQIRSLVRLIDGTNAANISQKLHAAFVEYFDAHPNYQRIASNFGTNGQGLASLSYLTGWSGENALAVYRTLSSSIPYDFAFVWSWNNFYSNGTWTGANSYGFGFSMAWHSSSQAWSGSINNNGNDSFFTSSRPWKSGSIVFPRANGPGGTWATNQNAPLKPFAISLAANLYQLIIVGDDDHTYSILQLTDRAQIGNAYFFFAFGQYLPATSSYNLPLMCFAFETLTKNSAIGSLTTAEINNQNGGISYSTSSNVRTFAIDYPQHCPRLQTIPATAFFSSSISTSYRYPISLWGFESEHGLPLGVLSGCWVGQRMAIGNLQNPNGEYFSFVGQIPGSLSMILATSGAIDCFTKGIFP
jgi:hypothetical protein